MYSPVFKDTQTNLRFDRDGYARIDAPGTRHAIHSALALFKTHKNKYTARHFSATPLVRDVTHKLNVNARLRGLFSKPLSTILVDYQIVWGGFFVKHPTGDESRVHLHQDFSICDSLSGRTVISAWIPLHRTHTNNGAISVVPKRHFLARSPRGYSQGATWPNGNIDALEARSECINLNAGQILIFHHGLAHSSAGNFTATDRIAIILFLRPFEKPLSAYNPTSNTWRPVSDDFYVRNRTSR